MKLQVLKKYLSAFTSASARAGGTVYLDLFAGQPWNRFADTGSTQPGSTKIALDTLPRFTRLVFWELASQAALLRRNLGQYYPHDDRWRVVAGDCNTTLAAGLTKIQRLRHAPTFAFVDPKGLQVSWSLLKQLAEWRIGKTKTELWILFPETALERVLGLEKLGRRTAHLLDGLYGGEQWVGIHQRRIDGTFTAAEARAEYINLLRWRLQRDLGYGHTHPLSFGNVGGAPVYTMVFATDHTVGQKIMGDIYGHAEVHEIPKLRAQALAARQIRRDDARGVLRLFDPLSPSVEPSQSEPIDPWEPPTARDLEVDLVDDDFLDDEA